MMSSRKEEERNEKIIRGLMKLPPNRRCINCNSLGPQYVCTNFWTFICITCSGLHREFTHRVKSVSMAKFTSQEVEALQRGGNQRAREIFLKDWDMQHQRFPDCSNVDRIRDFIDTVYIDKKYAGGRSFDKPPRDIQSPRNNEEESRRADSYHSYSQSPPYEHQYEDRRYGRQSGALTRKPGSDRGNYDSKLSSFFYSPGRLGEKMQEDRFANEGFGPRLSDYSVSSAGETQRSHLHSPNFHKDTGGNNPLQQGRNIIVEDAKRETLGTFLMEETKKDVNQIPQSKRNVSSSSFESFESILASQKSPNPTSLSDVMIKSEPNETYVGDISKPSSLPHSSLQTHAAGMDLFGLQFVAPSAESSVQSIDLFAHSNSQPSAAASFDQKAVTAPLSENEGWATFDMPVYAVSTPEMKDVPSAVSFPGDEIPKVTLQAFPSTNISSEASAVHSSVSHKPDPLVADKWDAALHDTHTLSTTSSSQMWNAFDDSIGNSTKTLFCHFSSNINSQASMPGSREPVDSMMGLKLMEGGYNHERKSANPFDLPYDSYSQSTSMFPGMNPLQSALPNSQILNPFASDIGQSWFPPHPMPPYMSSMPSGSLGFMAVQPAGPPLPNLSSQGPVTSVGGNPFA